MDNAKTYNRIKLTVSLTETFLTVVLLVILITTPLGRIVQDFAFIISGSDYIAFLIFIGILGLASGILFFPLTYYTDFHLEHKYSLSNQTFWKWIWEDLKGLFVSLALGIPLLLLFFYLIKSYPESWWFILATVLFLFSVVLARLAPTLIFPIFYKFTPLEDEELKLKIGKLCESANLSFSGIFKFDLSKNTKKANAGFTGIRKSKRIILSDTLLSGFLHEEILSVFAHELGHYKRRHILKNIFIGLIFSYVGLFLAAELYNYLFPTFGFSFQHQLAALPLLTLVLMLYGIVTMPIQNIISRKFEYEADEFALRSTKNRDAFISTMEKLAKTNLADKTPHRIVEFLFYSHPSIEKRIKAAKSHEFDQRNNYAAQTV